MIRLKRWIFPVSYLVSDGSVLAISFYISYRIRFHWRLFLKYFPVTKGTPDWLVYQNVLWLVIPLWIIVFFSWGHLYKKDYSDGADDFLCIAKSAVLSTLFMLAMTFLYKSNEYSRLLLAILLPISLFSMFGVRETIKLFVKLIIWKIIPPDSVILLGEGKSVEAVFQILQKDRHKILSQFSSDELYKAQEKIRTESLLSEIFIPSQWIEREEIQPILDECEERKIQIKVLPDLLEMRLGEISVDNSLGIPILHLKTVSLHGFRYFVKRCFDVTFSILVISLLFIPFLMISYLIAIDSKGGIFFQQQRVGFKEKKFKCFKFRTMFLNAETLLDEWNLNSFRGGPAFKMKGDPRITRVGKWLRKFSLDELPQIWNILKSDMSFIGPRPQVLREAAGNLPWAKKRFRVLPGITGLWQVSGRADLPYEEMMRLDIYYLENWSPGLDLRILLRTLPVILSGKGAY